MLSTHYMISYHNGGHATLNTLLISWAKVDELVVSILIEILAYWRKRCEENMNT